MHFECREHTGTVAQRIYEIIIPVKFLCQAYPFVYAPLQGLKYLVEQIGLNVGYGVKVLAVYFQQCLPKGFWRDSNGVSTDRFSI